MREKQRKWKKNKKKWERNSENEKKNDWEKNGVVWNFPNFFETLYNLISRITLTLLKEAMFKGN